VLQLPDLMIPRRHRDLLLLILNSDKEILVVSQVPDLPLTAPLRNDLHQINRPLAVVVNHLKVVVDVVAFVERENVVNEYAEAPIII